MVRDIGLLFWVTCIYSFIHFRPRLSDNYEP